MVILLLITGLGCFLLGLHVLKRGLSQLNNINLKSFISRFTKTPLTGCLTGTFLTFLLQSSGAVTVISIGMVDTGLMTFVQALGIVLGTNIGTTLTGQLMAFNFESWGLPMVGLGVLLMTSYRKKLKALGLNLIGLGLIFIGMNLIDSAFSFIQHYPLFFKLMALTNSSNILAIVFGAISTALIQSSSALTGIVLVLAKNQQLDLVTATAIILGSNIGTCVTAVLASIGATTNGKRVAMSHVVLNVLGVLIFYPLLVPFTDLMSFSSGNLPRQIANTSMVFNIISSIMVLPIAYRFAGLITWLVPEK